MTYSIVSKQKITRQSSVSPGFTLGAKEQVTTTSTEDLITSSPVDLEQIAQVTKFRSCEGHDSSGYNIDHVLESNRSMKHYLLPIPALSGSVGMVKEFAPFDGSIVLLFSERSKHGSQMWIRSSAHPEWIIYLYHIDTTLPVGTIVKSGDLVGYASLGQKENTFDIGLVKQDSAAFADGMEKMNTWRTTGKFSGEDKGKRLEMEYDSFLLHMTPEITAAYAARGLTPITGIFSKAERDAEPCIFGGPIDPITRVILT